MAKSLGLFVCPGGLLYTRVYYIVEYRGVSVMDEYYTTEEEQQEKAKFYQLVEMLETVSKDKNLTQLQAAEFSRLYYIKLEEVSHARPR